MICGAQIKAGRILAMLEQQQLPHAADITETTLRKLEHAGHKPVPGTARTLQAILDALNRHGVAMTDRGVSLIPKAESAQGATTAIRHGEELPPPLRCGRRRGVGAPLEPQGHPHRDQEEPQDEHRWPP